MKILTTLSLLAGLIIGPGNISDTYLLTSSSTITVEGTSSIHDWDVVSNNFEGKASFQLDEAGDLSIESLRIAVPAESLKSGHSGMDKNTYKALKTTEFPQVVFELKEVASITKEEGKFIIKANGDLTIIGNTRNICLSAICQTKADGTLLFEGKTTIKMTDYGVEPPIALFGTIKTGDEITIKYKTGFMKGNL